MSEYPSIEIVRDMIVGGLLDDYLSILRSDIDARVQGTREFIEFMPGDRVKINNLCRPKYLIGEEATITSVNRTKVKVKFDRDNGRFKASMNVSVPMNLLDKM